MLNNIARATAAAVIAVSYVSFASVATLTLSAEMAVAGNGHGNSGNRNGGGRNGHGQTASALGGLNAAHANQNALANAAPNSRVGKVAAYQREAIFTNELSSEAAAALDALAALPVPTRTSGDIQKEIDAAILAGLDTTALDAELAGALAYETAAVTAVTAAAATAEQEAIEATALEVAANKDVPTGEDLEALRGMLGLE